MGTKVTSHGLYETYSQYHAARTRGLVPQDIYIFSWMNFSSILMSLLSKHVTYDDLSQLIVGDSSTTLSAFLKSQLLVLWRSMLTQFSLLHEELEYLITELVHRLVKVSMHLSLHIKRFRALLACIAPTDIRLEARICEPIMYSFDLPASLTSL